MQEEKPGCFLSGTSQNGAEAHKFPDAFVDMDSIVDSEAEVLGALFPRSHSTLLWDPQQHTN